MDSIEIGPAATIASRYINCTNRHLFLTGRAGTGKTTFLHYIKERTQKRVMVAAPTGIAAINAGGVTLHSLFQLPFGSYIPDELPSEFSLSFKVSTKRSLMREIQMYKHKRRLLQELELLIIDEVSMLRADILDAIDTVLRSVRKTYTPFGGVQILFIGDLYQLPPIVKDDEWDLLQRYYEDINFFNAHALKNNPPVFIELNKIYRQTDSDFITILNHLRDNKITHTDLAELNKHFVPNYQANSGDGAIFLTTHNRKADSINSNELNKLSGKSYTYSADVEDNFPDYNFPIDQKLVLKEGAQVMFIKNDYSGEQRFFNGKIGFVSKLTESEITVSFNDGSEPAEVEKYTWENKSYTLNKESNEIEEKVKGTFKHYPLKLAWAITIHKSQGLTFDKAVIDVSSAFAPGQAYVALSRLTSLKGLTLTGAIPAKELTQNENIHQFVTGNPDLDHLERAFKKDEIAFVGEYILKAFDFEDVSYQLRRHIESYDSTKKRAVKVPHVAWAKMQYQDFKPLAETAKKFRKQLQFMVQNSDQDALKKIEERSIAAHNYFAPLIQNRADIVTDHIALIGNKKGTKTYITELKELQAGFENLKIRMTNSLGFVKAALHNSEYLKSEEQVRRPKSIKKTKSTPAKKKTTKEPKIPSREISFDLYKKGKTAAEIAFERQFAISTILSHLAYYIARGELDILDFATQEQVDKVFEIMNDMEDITMSGIKEIVIDDLTWSQIRMIMGLYQHQKDKSNE